MRDSTEPVLSVGQLRAALEGVPDEVRVRVQYVVDEHTADEQVAVAAGMDTELWYLGSRAYERPRSPAEAWFTIAAELPSDEYARGPR